MANPLMTKPLIKRPVAEIVEAARAAGREAFGTRATVEAAWLQARFDWIGRAFPSGEGMTDDAFGVVVEKACDAFSEGVDEYLALIDDNKLVSGSAVQALEREVKDEQFQVQCAQEMFVWLASIFRAIQRAADACPDMRSRGEIKRLAGCGQYLADDRADMLSDYAGEESSGGDHA